MSFSKLQISYRVSMERISKVVGFWGENAQVLMQNFPSEVPSQCLKKPVITDFVPKVYP